jgi:hypothetical protein
MNILYSLDIRILNLQNLSIIQETCVEGAHCTTVAFMRVLLSQ